ncbi:hypothetical protein [Eggerthella sp. YY7918]|uniref:hypothetical protein n=1 Tax=Eggerthella sp. (strain YY7918) TaxID=502558 RepID=UPI00021711ED|nr:hypothetical protein [Eggerthella sp. YY7918]BAK44724.1 hypothetical protein EGYY_15840 [Eggerthella sp. YY7918]
MTAAGNELDASDSRHRHACDKVLLERFSGDVVSRKEGGKKSAGLNGQSLTKTTAKRASSPMSTPFSPPRPSIQRAPAWLHLCTTTLGQLVKRYFCIRRDARIAITTAPAAISATPAKA